MVRELAFGSLEEDTAVVALFDRFDVPPDALQELMQVVRAGGVMTQCGLLPHYRALVQDMHDLSWFIAPFSDGSTVGLSKAGSRPGESWADVVFAFVYHKVLCEMKHAATAEGLVVQPCSSPMMACDLPSIRFQLAPLLLAHFTPPGQMTLPFSLGTAQPWWPYKRRRGWLQSFW